MEQKEERKNIQNNSLIQFKYTYINKMFPTEKSIKAAKRSPSARDPLGHPTDTGAEALYVC